MGQLSAVETCVYRHFAGQHRHLSFPRAVDMARDPFDAFARTTPADCFADIHVC